MSDDHTHWLPKMPAIRLSNSVPVVVLSPTSGTEIGRGTLVVMTAGSVGVFGLHGDQLVWQNPRNLRVNLDLPQGMAYALRIVGVYGFSQWAPVLARHMRWASTPEDRVAVADALAEAHQ